MRPSKNPGILSQLLILWMNPFRNFILAKVQETNITCWFSPLSPFIRLDQCISIFTILLWERIFVPRKDIIWYNEHKINTSRWVSSKPVHLGCRGLVFDLCLGSSLNWGQIRRVWWTRVSPTASPIHNIFWWKLYLTLPSQNDICWISRVWRYKNGKYKAVNRRTNNTRIQCSNVEVQELKTNEAQQNTTQKTKNSAIRIVPTPKYATPAPLVVPVKLRVNNRNIIWYGNGVVHQYT